jgi:hypothetical protein
MTTEVMKQALDALGIATTLFVSDRQEGLSAMTLFVRDRQEILSAIAALREAIEQSEKQEPIGYEHHEFRPFGAPGEIRIHGIFASQYRHPDGTIGEDFQWLADQYKQDKTTIKLMPLYYHPSVKEESGRRLLIRSRNLLSQPSHWVNTPENAESRAALSVEITQHLNSYTAPPKREWIDLTDEEIETIIADHMGLVRTVSFAIEAGLKEKNR